MFENFSDSEQEQGPESQNQERSRGLKNLTPLIFDKRTKWERFGQDFKNSGKTCRYA